MTAQSALYAKLPLNSCYLSLHGIILQLWLNCFSLLLLLAQIYTLPLAWTFCLPTPQQGFGFVLLDLLCKQLSWNYSSTRQDKVLLPGIQEAPQYCYSYPSTLPQSFSDFHTLGLGQVVGKVPSRPASAHSSYCFFVGAHICSLCMHHPAQYQPNQFSADISDI